MDQQRGYRFFTKRSEHYDNLQRQEKEELANNNNNLRSTVDSQKESAASLKPLKDNSNIRRLSSELNNTLNGERPLKCLETLAEKAGISLDEKTDLNGILDKSQSPSQGGAPQQVPLQLSHEQLQQLQHQLQFQPINIKQEYPTSQQLNTAHLTAELKSQLLDQQMQVMETQSQSPHQVPTSVSINQSGATTINTLSPLQAMPGQVPADWQHGRVQVLPQAIQNTQYLQQLYSQPVVMSGNIIPGIGGQQQIQLITAGKPFQSSPITAQQMIAATSQGKQVIGGTAGNFSGTYALPTIPSSQSQTLVISPFNMISSQNQQGQQNIIPTIAATPASNSKQVSQQDQMQKQLVAQKLLKNNTQNINQNTSMQINQNAQQGQQCVQVSGIGQILSPVQQTGAQAMQVVNPWIPNTSMQMPFWTNGLQPQTLLPNSILIRGTHPDGSGMFIQQATPSNAQHTVQSQAQNQSISQMQCGVSQSNQPQQKVRPVADNISVKQSPRAQPLLPQVTPPIRPASSVSTQTAQTQNPGILTPKSTKVRTKQPAVRPAGTIIKQDMGNQTKLCNTPQMQQVVTSAGNKMVVMSTGLSLGLQQSNDKQLTMQYQQQLKNVQGQQQAQALMQQQQQQHQQQQAIQQQIALQTMQNHSASMHMQAQPHTQGIVFQGQQMIIQNQNGQPTLTVASNNINMGVAQPNLQQLSIQPKPQTQSPIQGNQHYDKVSQPINSSVTTPSSQNTQNIQMLASSQNNIMGSLTSTQVPIQPPQNPLLAMSNLSAAPLSVSSIGQTAQQYITNKDTVEFRNNMIPPCSTPTVQVNSTTPNSTSQSPLILSNVVSQPTKPQPVSQNTTSSSANSGKNEMNPEGLSMLAPGNTNKVESLSAIIGSSEPSQTEKIQTAENIKNVDNVQNSESNISTSNSITTPTSIVVVSSQPSTTNDSQCSPQVTTTSPNVTVGISTNVTSINAISKCEKDLPKAMVKPNVLTHIIEGYIIQESQEPFPVSRQRYSDRDELDEPPKKKLLIEKEMEAGEDKVSCAHCGKLENKSKIKKKRYCSLNCAKANKGENNHNKPIDDSSSNNVHIKAEPSVDSTNVETANDDTNLSIKINTPVTKWSVREVCEFIAEVLKTDEYTEDFTNQEIDGPALILLKEKHLVNAMQMKLGPALKIVAKVQSLLINESEDAAQQNASGSANSHSN